jgi:hypothetical protein
LRGRRKPIRCIIHVAADPKIAKIEGFPGAEVVVWDGDEGTITVGFVDDKAVAAATWKKK